MANIKITDLTAYTDAASTDVLPIVDVGADVTKKITIGNVVKAVPLGTAALPGLAFDGDPNSGVYSPGADQVAISTGGTGRLFVDASGKLGVGTNSPSNMLHIEGSSPSIRLKETSGPRHMISPFSGDFYIEADPDNSSASTNLIFTVDGGEAARIDSSQRLLVGTSTATNNLRLSQKLGIVHAGAAYTGFALTGYAGTSANICPLVDLNRSRGTSDGSFTKVESNDRLGLIIFRGADGSQFVDGAYIEAFADGATGANDLPTRLVFSTTADAAASPTERLRITSAGVLQIAEAGNIAVGTTTGTKIGTATTQKLGFYNATPVVQPAAVADATDAATVITQLNDLLAKLRTLGLIAT